MHDKGNEENVFDRVDYQLSKGRFDSPEPGIYRAHGSRRPTTLTAKMRRRGMELVVANGGLGSERQRRRPYRPTRPD